MKMLAPLEIGLSCRDLDSLSAFYRGVLGFAVVGEATVPADKAAQAAMSGGGYRVMRLQTPYGERIKLLQPEHAAAPASPTPRVLDRVGNAYLTFIVEDLAAMLARLQAAGLVPLTGSAPVDIRPGIRMAFCRDPEGNILEFVHMADIAAYRPDLA